MTDQQPTMTPPTQPLDTLPAPSPTAFAAPSAAAGSESAPREPATWAVGGIPTGPNGPGAPVLPSALPTPTAPRRGRGELVAVAALAAVLASAGTYAVGQVASPDVSGASVAASASSGTLGSQQAAPVTQADPSAPNWTATAKAVTPSVVAITARTNSGEGQGSGVVIDRSGHILTNNHVVAGATGLTVTLADGRTYAATVRGTDPSTDLAVVTVTNPPADLAPIAIADSDALAVGDPVMAIGNPLGLAGTVTTGIVSALDRPVTTAAEGTQGATATNAEPVVTNAIQTSAAINPGNSGGALVNASGALVGINSAIASLGSSGESGNIGIGFAIPANEAQMVATQLIADGTATHAYLGVTPKDGTAKDGSATRAGAEIANVGADTPAAAAGIRVGDVVIAVDGTPVESAASLVAHVRERAVGSKVALTLLREGTRVEVTATLASRPSTTN